ncbi:MAG: sulfurtransferase [Candidatus Rokuibacteriota bacterium]
MSDWPRPLIETSELTSRLADPRLRLLECTTVLTPLPDHSGYRAESGRALYDAGHLPGAAFVDLLSELSDTTSPLRFTMPKADQLASALGRAGVGSGTFVVAYCRSHNTMAARLWWMLRAIGFDDAAVLNGGWKQWTSDGRPVSTTATSYTATTLNAQPRPGLFVGKDDVRAAIHDGRTLLVNALSREQHEGRGGIHYGRPGRIAGSRCVPARELIDPATHAYLPPARLREMFQEAGALGEKGPPRVITYCGGGIAASSDALILTLLGAPDVAVYDNSLSEWARDPSLPMEP